MKYEKYVSTKLTKEEMLHLSLNREGKEDDKSFSLLWCDVAISDLAIVFASV